MKAVQLLVNSALPEDLRNYGNKYDVKDMNKILYAVAQKHPEQFADVEKKLSDFGRKSSYLQGATITLKDLEPVVDKKALFSAMNEEIKALPKDKDFIKNRRVIFNKYNDLLSKSVNEVSLKNRNNIAMAVLSGARGKAPQLKAMIGSPWQFSDYKGEPIDVISKNSFAEGIDPATFLASTYGARASVISTKSATAKGGDLAKQFASTAVDVTVQEENCHTHNGLALPVDDKSLIGRALANDVAGHKAGEFITADTVTDLRKKGVKNVVARSAMTCRAHSGVCAHCVGKFFNGGKLAKVGDSVGLMASTSTAEPITQMALCLSADTEVLMDGGSVKKISAISVGDTVIGSDITGKHIPVKVLNVFDQGMKPCLKYTFFACCPGWDSEDDVEVVCTADHKFLTPDKEVKRIADTDVVMWNSGLPLKKLRDDEEVGLVHCYDIEVDHQDHLFVLANGLITSNSAKHTAGMTAGKKTYAGIPVIQQFTQSPEKYKDKAVVSTLDGKVEKIEDAEQGGTYITVNGKKHYVQPGHPAEVHVGDTVEAGDFLSEGLPDIEDVVKYKGLGEGRRQYATRLNQILADSGTPTDPRNTEILARGALRHVRVTSPDGFGNYLPDDLIDYAAAEQTYKMPETTRAASPGDAIGDYLQQPFLHYTIGTRITPKVAKDLKDNGYDRVFVDKTTPSFAPEMVRLRSASHTTRDWLASLGTSYLTQQLEESATRGDDTNVEHNPDYRPRIAYGKDFGKNVRETGEF